MLDKAKARQIAQEYTNEVCRALNPKSVILFGSFVNGTPHEYSDIDIAVVFDGYKGDRYDTAVMLQRLRRNIDDSSGGGIEPHLLDEANDRSGFLSHIKKTGELIYGQ
ncbi:MAG: nucleotidyltransferase domain-containing protein [Oscillospiraceae bacterium]|nr:nucleotidyltransferase domain-containing protein [Oscillospiraceae bacterium]